MRYALQPWVTLRLVLRLRYSARGEKHNAVRNITTPYGICAPFVCPGNAWNADLWTVAAALRDRTVRCRGP